MVGMPGLVNKLFSSPSPTMNQPMTVVRPPYANKMLPPGMILQGNLDPTLMANGTQSNEFVHHGVHAETIIPGSGQQAVNRYIRTGEHFGKFDTPDNADAFVKTYGQPHFMRGK